MDNNTPGDDVTQIVAMATSDSTTNWEDALVAIAETRDKSLYAQLFQHFAPKIKAYIRRLGLIETTADELVQETMLSVWRKAHMYKPDKARASTWIFTLARNQSIDRMRKQKYPEYELEEWQEEADESVDECENSVTSYRLATALSKLPENQSQVLYMSFFEGRSHSEIAARLNIPLGSVKSRIRLASEKLRTIWGGAL
ncbi:sigma-70 family RNA polymerase sigma factor [Agaribacterium sp. ZY112]|uniref:sigma-70 family RNA polymerase sigma factor n=1 Tax=Agaribacterium sp. ZY112 TaxID=3233574 RepID=UPI003524B1BC